MKNYSLDIIFLVDEINKKLLAVTTFVRRLVTWMFIYDVTTSNKYC